MIGGMLWPNNIPKNFKVSRFPLRMAQCVGRLVSGALHLLVDRAMILVNEVSRKR
jgi:hypothetical protein